MKDGKLKIIYIKTLIITCSCLFFNKYAASNPFVTNNYVVDIIYNCQEGDISCQNMTVYFFDKKTCRLNKIIGKTINNPNNLNVQGYYFSLDGRDYFLYTRGKSELDIYNGKKLYLSESIKDSDKIFSEIIQLFKCE